MLKRPQSDNSLIKVEFLLITSLQSVQRAGRLYTDTRLLQTTFLISLSTGEKLNNHQVKSILASLEHSLLMSLLLFFFR